MINHQCGHARIVAVAGAGKTTTLVEFVKARCQQGAAPRRFLILMYNKAAQVDFQHKLQQSFQMADGMNPGVLPTVRTFHSLGWRLYRNMIERGFLAPVESKPISEREVEGVVWRLLQQIVDTETRSDILAQRRKWVEPAVNFIERVKAGLESPELVFEQSELPPECRLYLELFDRFEEWRKQQQRITFSDMIYDPMQCLLKNAEAKAVFAGHMDWILVDEYQDINGIQHELLKILRGDRGSVVVIGDPDQTIYEFRGSRPEFIVEQFNRDFAPVTDFKLSHTFRYGHELALPANQLIQQNQQRLPMLAVAASSLQKTEVHWHQGINNTSKVLEIIEPYHQQNRLSEVVILHRLWSQSAAIELTLLAHQIPYQLDHSQSVLNRYELQLFWCLLDIGAGEFAQQSDSQRRASWQLLLTQPFPKIKREILDGLALQLQPVQQGLGEALQRVIPNTLSKWQQQQLQTRAELLAELEYSNKPSGRLLQDYIDQTDYQEGLKETAFSNQQVDEQWQMVKALLSFLKSLKRDCRQTVDYLRQLRQQHAEMMAQGAGKRHGSEDLASSESRVLLTSIHKSKGREWPVVILPDLDHRYYPYQPERDRSEADNIETERRLLYVAMTRARHAFHGLLPTNSTGKTSSTDKMSPKGSRPSQSTSANPVADQPPVDSPFANELARQPCAQLVNKIRQLSEQPEESQASSSLQLPAMPQHQLKLLMRYLEAIKQPLELTLALPAQLDKESAASSTTIQRTGKVIERRDNWLRVTHKTLGEGVLVKADDDYLSIQFDGEPGIRTFQRQAAEPLIKYLN